MYKLWVNFDDYVVAVDAYDYDYIEERDFTDENGFQMTFYNYNEAVEWINKNIKPEKIHPRDKKPKFRREEYLL